MTTPETPAEDTTPQPPADEPQLESPADPEPSANSEAARWRTKLREAEAERDALADRVTGYQRRECEQVAADLLAQPADLWDIARADVADFFNDDGSVNEDELRSAAAALLKMRPGLAKGAGVPTERNWGQNGSLPPAGPVGWNSVIGSR